MARPVRRAAQSVRRVPGRVCRVLHRLIPEVVTLYPWEAFVSALALLIGIPLLIGLAAPTSLVTLLPPVIYWTYASALVVGGGTVGLGLRARNAPAIASGLRLLGGSWAVYALAAVAISGWAVAWLVFASFALVGVVCFARAHHFHYLIDLQRSVRQQGRT